MPSSKKLTGMAWHTEYLSKDKNDSRRHRTRCMLYDRNDKSCSYYSKCIGATHCDYYKEKSRPKVQTAKTEDKGNQPAIDSFEGIEKIPVSLVTTNKPFSKPNEQKVNRLIQYYNKHGHLDKPIYVSCKGTKYVLEDRYLRLYVARLLGIKKIHAKIGSKEDCKREDKLISIGNRIYHKVYGSGTITEVNLSSISVKLDSGTTVLLSIETCIKNKLISLV